MRSARAWFLMAMMLLLSPLPVFADPTDLEGGLEGFTHTGVLVGNTSIFIEVPFSPALREDRAVFNADALARGSDMPIFLPVDEKATPRMDALAEHYMMHLNFGPPQVIQQDDPPWVKRLVATAMRFKKLAKTLVKYVNPRIKTKNFDIQFIPMWQHR